MKAIVILSGGLDSAVNLAWACREFSVERGITFDYGQRAARRESERSAALCRHYGVPHEVVPLPFLSSWTATALVSKEKPLPKLKSNQLDRKNATSVSAKAVWVPNRNGVFINVAAALAESLGVERLVVGFNREEGATFPDNSPPFVEAANAGLKYSTLNRVEVVCRTLALDKKEIAALGVELGLPFEHIWSCYEGEEKMCGLCESCLRLKRAVESQSPALLEVLSFAR